MAQYFNGDHHYSCLNISIVNKIEIVRLDYNNLYKLGHVHKLGYMSYRKVPYSLDPGS